MGDALGKGLWAAFLVICFMALTGGIALISGIVALLAHGVAKTVAAWIFGISLGLFSLPILGGILNSLKDSAAVARYHREYKKERTKLILTAKKISVEQGGKSAFFPSAELAAKIPELPKSQLIAKASEPAQEPNPEKHLELNDMEDNW